MTFSPAGCREPASLLTTDTCLRHCWGSSSPLLHRLVIICYQQASKSKKLSCVCTKSTAAVPDVKPISVQAYLVAAPSGLNCSTLLAFFFLLLYSVTEERLRARYGNASTQNTNFSVCRCFNFSLVYQWCEFSRFSASLWLMVANRCNKSLTDWLTANLIVVLISILQFRVDTAPFSQQTKPNMCFSICLKDIKGKEMNTDCIPVFQRDIIEQ